MGIVPALLRRCRSFFAACYRKNCLAGHERPARQFFVRRPGAGRPDFRTADETGGQTAGALFPSAGAAIQAASLFGRRQGARCGRNIRRIPAHLPAAGSAPDRKRGRLAQREAAKACVPLYQGAARRGRPPRASAGCGKGSANEAREDAKFPVFSAFLAGRPRIPPEHGEALSARSSIRPFVHLSICLSGRLRF